MHSYGKHFHYTAHIHVLLGLVAASIYLALKDFVSSPELPISPFVTITIFGALEIAFNKWGWRALALIPPLKIHDFNGIYQGEIVAKDGSKYPAKITITQTWSEIEIDFKSGVAGSKSFSASITQGRESRDDVELIYNYFAPGNHTDNGRIGAHYGTTMLKRSDDGAALAGGYYTEHQHDSYGQVAFKRLEAH